MGWQEQKSGKKGKMKTSHGQVIQLGQKRKARILDLKLFAKMQDVENLEQEFKSSFPAATSCR